MRKQLSAYWRTYRAKQSFDFQQKILIRKLRKNRDITNKISQAGLIYVHIPKCGGSSVKKALLPYYDFPPGHYSANTYREALGEHDYSNLHRFTVVRNPWDRLVSAYFYVMDKRHNKYSPNTYFRDKVLAKYIDFEDFVVSHIGEGKSLNFNHFVPQYKFICDESEKIIVDNIIKLEDLTLGFEKLGKSLGRQFQLSVVNTSKREKDYRSYYNEKTKKIVEDVYSIDSNEFEYEF